MILRCFSFGAVVRTVFFLGVMTQSLSAHSATTCLPGIPCVTNATPNNPVRPNDGPNRSSAPNAAKSGSAACDADFMNQIYARAFLEASRETIIQSTMIRKPDSVLEYTCFDQQVAESAEKAASIFSESPRFQDTSVPNLGGNSGGFMSLLGSLASGFDIELTLPVDDLLAQAEEAIGDLELPEGIAEQLEGLSSTEMIEKLRADYPETLEKFEEYAGDSAENIAGEVSHAANEAAKDAIESGKQAVRDAANAAVERAEAEIEAAVNAPIDAARAAVAQAVGPTLARIESVRATAAAAVNTARSLANEKVGEAGRAEAYLESLEDRSMERFVSAAELDQARAYAEQARAAAAAAQQAVSDVQAAAAAAAEQAQAAAEQAEALAERVEEFEDIGRYADQAEALAKAEELQVLADGFTEAADAVNAAADGVIALADSAEQLVESAAQTAIDAVSAGLDALGITALVDEITGAIGNLLSLSGIQSSTEIALNTFLGAEHADMLLNSLIMGALSDFTSVNFSHDFLGGALTGFGYDSASSVGGAAGTCNHMNSVYFLARCEGFGLDAPFMTFEELASADPRSLPESCDTPMPITTALIDVAKNKEFRYAAYDKTKTFIDYLDAASCKPPVPTGLTIKITTYSMDLAGNYNPSGTNIIKDNVCVNPGCYYDGSTCKVGP